MKIKKTAAVFAVCLCGLSAAGCGSSEEMNVYKQAGMDLEQGSYEQALAGFEASVTNQVKLPQSYRGAGLASFYMGDYDGACEYFTKALQCEKVSDTLKKDILSYRATAQLKAGMLDGAMADCQTLAEDFDMDADLYFLSGKVALAMDSYDEAAADFDQAYVEDAGYEMAIRIYEAYLEADMEADGTRYLEATLTEKPKTAEDYCSRGQIYYYMEDYNSAKSELIKATHKNSTQALLLLGMVYLGQNDISNARAMYQQYISAVKDSAEGYNGLALCDIAEGNYQAALNDITTGLPIATTDEMQRLLYNEIVAYEKMLDFSTAKTKAQEYLEMFPDDENISRELVFLNSRVH